MFTKNSDINDVKQVVLTQLAKLAFDGTIIRQRVRLAETALLPQGSIFARSLCSSASLVIPVNNPGFCPFQFPFSAVLIDCTAAKQEDSAYNPK